VPLMLRLPGRIEPGRHPHPVSLVDLAPTVLDLLRIPRPRTLHGRDLFEVRQRPTLVEGKQFRSVVVGDRKHVRFDPRLTRWREAGAESFRETADLYYRLGDGVERELPRPVRLPRPEPPPTPPLHLLAFHGEGRYTGRIDAPVLTATLRGQAPGDTLEVERGGVRFSVTAASAPPVLAFTLRVPGSPTLRLEGGDPPPRLLFGPHGLPLLAPGPAVTVSRDVLPHLGIGAGQRPRFDGPPCAGAKCRAALRWWTQRIADGGPEPFTAEATDADVMDAMRDWGYAK